MSTTEVPQESLAHETGESVDNSYQAVPLPDERGAEFDYRPVSPLAPISLFFGLCAAAGFLAWEALAIAVMGMLLGIVAVWKISRSGGEIGGGMLAKIGLMLSVFCLVGGSAYQTYAYVTELPEGHKRISFSWLSGQAPTITNGEFKLDEDVAALDGKDVYIKGYMYPSKKTEGITDFVLVKDSGDCCFGGNPPITDMVMVHLRGGLNIKLRGQRIPVGIGGKFRIAELRRTQDGLAPIYTLEGYHVR